MEKRNGKGDTGYFLRALRPTENQPVPFLFARRTNPAAFLWLGEQPLPRTGRDFDHRYYDHSEQTRQIEVKENSVQSSR